MTRDGTIDQDRYHEVREAITHAYKALRRQDYFCRSNFWCCQTCGLAAIPEGRERYVFYHRQDDDRLKEGGACMLAWGGDGATIVAALQRAGLAVEWDGTAEQRIAVVGFTETN